ncbi:DUF397 domain-containing protein [Streptomyces roseirectus]|uniref:DUF397 domain-containing protein n=1 Tax=Streptomyces roseirectus TaxID=2768066 RepID=A0A7H0IIK3_9ACTN|nr:DUF397 domain-containing protein [Streptomyces roseirectus]QNP72619.1 DUF397 domain-containing protein [Streptomyces roseirectus]
MRVTPDLSGAQWRKSTYTGGEAGDNCVEVAHNIPHLIPVRDSKTPHTTPLTFTPHAWQTFITATRDSRH